MKSKPFFLIGLLVIVLLVFPRSFVNAAPSAQQGGQFATPTPQPDGRIIYIVQAGDNCTRIQLLTGVSVDDLRTLNKLDADCNLTEGQPLLLGFGGPAAATLVPGATPTPGVDAAIATPSAGSGEVCVLLFNDINGDTLRQNLELGVEGGAVSLTNVDGSYSQTLTTVSELDPVTIDPVFVCFLDVPEGEYTISMAIPDGYNPTMEMNFSLNISAGDSAFVDFGAQSETLTIEDPSGNDNRGSNLMFGLIGGFLIMSGVGLALYARRLKRFSSYSLRR